MATENHIDAIIYSATGLAGLLLLGFKIINEHYKTIRDRHPTGGSSGSSNSEFRELREEVRALAEDHKRHVANFNSRKEYLDNWQEDRDKRMKSFANRIEEVEEDNSKTRSAMRKFLEHQWSKIT